MNGEKRPSEDILEEILAWIRFQNIPRLKKVLEETLGSNQDKWVYELTDGKLSGSEIAKKVGISKSTVTRNWRKWHKLGIVKRLEETTAPRYEKLASLEDIGITLEGLSLENKTENEF